MEIRKNEIIELEITEINNLGAGVGRLADGRVVFTAGAVTGDRVRAKIIKVNKSYCVARLEEIVRASEYREDGFCDAPLSCGGCVYRNIKYSHELELKRNYVKHAFIKAGLPDVAVGEVLTTGRSHGYRNKAQMPLKQGKNGIEAGFYASKTHNVVSFEHCSLEAPIFSDITRAFCSFMTEKGVSVYDENTGEGLLRHLYLRCGFGSGEIMLCVVINGDALPFGAEFCDFIRGSFPQIKSVMVNINKKNTNVILGERFECIGGVPYLTDVLCGKRFRISAGSFYQVNHDGAELLYSKAAELAELSGEETLLDLYCGIGTIGLSMSDRVKRPVGVEIIPEAVECAKINAELNGVRNAEFFCGDASSTESLLSGLDRVPDVVLLDPPRKGSTPELIEYISRLGVKKVVYISCDPDTLARDCAFFRTLGYDISEVTPVDMFSRTGHVETVCLLSKLQNRQHIEIEPHMDEPDMTDAEKKATYPEIKDYVMEHYGYKIPSLYIAQVKQKCGIIERENYNKSKYEHPRQAKCPPEKEAAIMEALRHFVMI